MKDNERKLSTPKLSRRALTGNLVTMTENQTPVPEATIVSQDGVLKKYARWAAELIGSYLLGIVACIALTEAEFNLAGTNLLLVYMCLAPIGVLFWFISAIQAYPSLPFEALPAAAVLFIPIAGEALSLFGVIQVQYLRARWFGFPVGFVGTLGLYWAASLTI